MPAQIEELRVEGDEAPPDTTGVWGYLDQRGGLYGWDPDTPFPGYLILSGASPLRSEASYRRAVADSRIADAKAQAARTSRRGTTPAAKGGAKQTDDETDPGKEGDDTPPPRSGRSTPKA